MPATECFCRGLAPERFYRGNCLCLHARFYLSEATISRFTRNVKQYPFARLRLALATATLASVVVPMSERSADPDVFYRGSVSGRSRKPRRLGRSGEQSRRV